MPRCGWWSIQGTVFGVVLDCPRIRPLDFGGDVGGGAVVCSLVLRRSLTLKVMYTCGFVRGWGVLLLRVRFMTAGGREALDNK